MLPERQGHLKTGMVTVTAVTGSHAPVPYHHYLPVRLQRFVILTLFINTAADLAVVPPTARSLLPGPLRPATSLPLSDLYHRD